MQQNLTKDFNKVFYQVEASIYDERHPEVLEGNYSWWNEMAKEFVSSKDNTESLKIIDIGCGTGFVAHIISQHISDKDQLICYDLSLPMLREAKRKLGPTPACRVDYIVGEAHYLPIRSHTIDLITINALLHHLDDCAPLLKEVDRLLKSGGYIVLAHEPNKLFFSSPVIRLMASLYKLLGFGKTITNDMCILVNKELKKRRLVEEDLSKDEILKMVEFNSPVEQSSVTVDKDKGFVPKELLSRYFPEYKILALNEYSTFFIRPAFENVKWLGRFVQWLGKLLLGKGNLFNVICEK
jgi:ubiquinone/menaquinone biosynthesis C-methylase UbiE